jgi:hypothetical protein
LCKTAKEVGGDGDNGGESLKILLKKKTSSISSTKQLSPFPLPDEKGRRKSSLKTVSLVFSHYNLRMKLDPRQVSSYYCHVWAAQKRINNNNNSKTTT